MGRTNVLPIVGFLRRALQLTPSDNKLGGGGYEFMALLWSRPQLKGSLRPLTTNWVYCQMGGMGVVGDIGNI